LLIDLAGGFTITMGEMATLGVSGTGIYPHYGALRATSNDYSTPRESLIGFVFGERQAGVPAFGNDHLVFREGKPVS
jgi:hypothetical protein